MCTALTGPDLHFFFLKNREEEEPIQQDYDYPTSQYHDPLEYDYGDYVEGYQNYVKPQRPKTLGQRVAKWFGGFKIPSKKSVSKNKK